MPSWRSAWQSEAEAALRLGLPDPTFAAHSLPPPGVQGQGPAGGKRVRNPLPHPSSPGGLDRR